MSAGLSKKLRQLDDFLCSAAVDDDAMLLSELDGFLAGVIVCPDLIQPSEWLPVVWGEEAPVFDSSEQAESVIGLIMGHYNDMIRQMDRGGYRAIFDLDRDDTMIWEIWIEGFWTALHLRPEAWQNWARDEREDLQSALFVMGRLGELANRPDDFQSLDIDSELEELAPDLIPEYVEVLHRARLDAASETTFSPFATVPKVGRNDPCPCGSGKKFKKCCLN